MPCLHKIAAGGRCCSRACGGPNGSWAHVQRRFTVELQTGARWGGVRVVMLGQSQHRESIPYPRLLRRAIEFPLQYTDRDLLLLGGAFHAHFNSQPFLVGLSADPHRPGGCSPLALAMHCEAPRACEVRGATRSAKRAPVQTELLPKAAAACAARPRPWPPGLAVKLCHRV